MIRSFSLKKASNIAILMSIITIFLHVLVIMKVIPYTLVNGGMVKSFDSALVSSIIGIITLSLFVPVYIFAGDQKRRKKISKIITYLTWGLFVFFCLSTILQITGTSFEKYVTSPICILSVIACFRLAIG